MPWSDAPSVVITTTALVRQGWFCADCKEFKLENGDCCDPCACKGCADGKKVSIVQVCVKEHYVCGCKKSCCTDDKDKPGNCKCAKPLTKETNNSLIVSTCASCMASSPLGKDKVVHKDDCKKKDVIKTSCTH